jgi:hypothetical protein
MKKIWELKQSDKFTLNDVNYYVWGPIQRISQTSIIRICVNQQTNTLVEMNANQEVLLIENDGSSN